MRSVQTLVVVGALALLAAASPAAAQPTQGDVQFGGLRVPACPTADDPEYGLTREKPVEIGGGPLYMAARKARYFASLRGPQGQTLRVAPGVGSAPAGTAGEIMFIDDHSVSYDGPDGPVTVTIFMNAYRFTLPRAPAGFTCGTPLPTAVGVPPVNPIAAAPHLIALAAEHAARGPVALAPLDPGGERGYLADQFAMIAVRARAAAASGSALPPATTPPAETQGLVVLGFPQTCGGRPILPQEIELTGPRGPLPRNGALMRGETLERVLPGVSAPPGALAARFPVVQGAQVRITYAEGCDGAPASVVLPVRVEPARLVTSSPPAMPAGVTEADPTIYLQAIIDVDGRFVRPVYVGGPQALLPAALESVEGWRAQPLRVNGVPTVNPIVLQVTFR